MISNINLHASDTALGLIQPLLVRSRVFSPMQKSGVFKNFLSLNDFHLRPSQLLDIIDACYAIAQDSTIKDPFWGDEDYAFCLDDILPLTLEDIVKFSKQYFGPGFSLLDIGTGGGLNLKKINSLSPDSTIVGTSAKYCDGDLRPDTQINERGVTYLVGPEYNVERLLENHLLSNRKFHVVISSCTMLHLKDPVLALIQLYEILLPGGILIIDHFRLFGLEGCLLELLKYMERLGYIVLGTFRSESSNKYSTFIIIKTNEQLFFPVNYSMNPRNEITYAYDAHYLEFHKTCRLNEIEYKFVQYCKVF